MWLHMKEDKWASDLIFHTLGILDDVDIVIINTNQLDYDVNRCKVFLSSQPSILPARLFMVSPACRATRP
eukprot:4889868-Pleurochrysis_carterae.AAC.1